MFFPIPPWRFVSSPLLWQGRDLSMQISTPCLTYKPPLPRSSSALGSVPISGLGYWSLSPTTKASKSYWIWNLALYVRQTALSFQMCLQLVISGDPLPAQIRKHKIDIGRSRWACATLAADVLLGSRVRIPLTAWRFISCVFRVLCR
jgi:hypothetical protein